MAKVRNYVIYRTDQKDLERLREEYELGGRQTKLEDGRLIVFARPQRKAKEQRKTR